MCRFEQISRYRDMYKCVTVLQMMQNVKVIEHAIFGRQFLPVSSCRSSFSVLELIFSVIDFELCVLFENIR